MFENIPYTAAVDVSARVYRCVAPEMFENTSYTAAVDVWALVLVIA